MPQSACRYVAVDAVLPVSEIGPLLFRLAKQPAAEEREAPMSEQTDLEAKASAGDAGALEQADSLGAPSPFSCPDCGGVLVEFYDGDLLRFRCQVGHAFSQESLFAQQDEVLDRSLWAAFRALDERAHLGRRLAKEARAYRDTFGERRFERIIEEAEAQKAHIRRTLIKEDAN
jgi:two-component system chemotaxis response regulator CheB